MNLEQVREEDANENDYSNASFIVGSYDSKGELIFYEKDGSRINYVGCGM